MFMWHLREVLNGMHVLNLGSSLSTSVIVPRTMMSKHTVAYEVGSFHCCSSFVGAQSVSIVLGIIDEYALSCHAEHAIALHSSFAFVNGRQHKRSDSFIVLWERLSLISGHRARFRPAYDKLCCLRIPKDGWLCTFSFLCHYSSRHHLFR